MTSSRSRTRAPGLAPAATAPARVIRPLATPSAARDNAQPAPQAASHRAAVAPSAGQLRRAATDPSASLPPALAATLSQRVGADFSGVRVHRGEASHAAAESLGANAFTLGRHVHLSRAADNLSAADRDALLAHEAMHSAQQGGGDVAAHDDLAVGRAGDASEQEAERIAAALKDAPAPSGRERMPAAMPPPTLLTQRHAPRIQRDLKGPYKSPEGQFDLKLTTESSKGAKSGMKGSIAFTPSADAPDSKNIRLLQVVKTKNTTTGKDHVYVGAEANRNKTMTTADKSSGVEAGYFVDHKAAAATPRTAKADAAVSPYYRDYWPNVRSSQDGSKKGSTIAPASLWDFPGADFNVDFKFETAAKAADTGYIYATLTWGFRISDAANGTVTGEYADAHYVQSATFNAAVKQFDEFYKNPGAASAPAK